MNSSPHDDARTYRRYRLQQRQTVFFGSIIVVLAALFILAWLQYFRLIPSPFAREFTTQDSATEPTNIACPAGSDVYLAPGDVRAAVLNGTETSGLAGQVQTDLTNMGFSITGVGNWGGAPVEGIGLITVSPDSIAEGYSLAVVLPGAPVYVVNSLDDGTVRLVIGQGFAELNPIDTLVPGDPIPSPEACQ